MCFPHTRVVSCHDVCPICMWCLCDDSKEETATEARKALHRLHPSDKQENGVVAMETEEEGARRMPAFADMVTYIQHRVSHQSGNTPVQLQRTFYEVK